MTDAPPRSGVHDSSRTSPPGRSARLRPALLVFVGSALGIGLLFWPSMENPPFWDAAWTVAAGAAELNRTGMNLVELLQQPEFYEGGPGTHSTSILTVLWALILTGFGPGAWLPVIHIVNILMAAGLVAAIYALAARFVPRTLALLVAAATVTIPLILQQVADPYLDLPLALITILAIQTVVDRRWLATVLLVAAAVALKPSGLVLLVLIPFATVGSRRVLIGVATAALPIIPFAIRETRFASRPELAESGGPLLWLSLLNLGMVPELLLILGAGILAALRLRKERWSLAAPVLALILAYFGVYSFTIGVTRSIVFLPRYLVMVLPLTVLISVVDMHRRSAKVAHLAMASLLVFSMLNLMGRAQPLPDHPNPVIAERSLAAQEYLALQRATTSRLGDAGTEAIVADSHMWFRLAYPELGYVNRTPPRVVRPSELLGPLPASFAWAVEPHDKVMDDNLMGIAEDRGYLVERLTIFDGRWTSELAIARR